MLERGRSEEANVPLDYLKQVREASKYTESIYHDYHFPCDPNPLIHLSHPQVHKHYDRWLLHRQPRPPPAPVLVIDADQGLEEVKRQFDLKKQIIMGQKAAI